MAETAPEGMEDVMAPATRMRPPERAVVAALGVCGIVLAVNQLFNLQFFVGAVFLDNRYLLMLAGIVLG
jgi:hypothetical protein